MEFPNNKIVASENAEWLGTLASKPVYQTSCGAFMPFMCKAWRCLEVHIGPPQPGLLQSEHCYMTQ